MVSSIQFHKHLLSPHCLQYAVIGAEEMKWVCHGPWPQEAYPQTEDGPAYHQGRQQEEPQRNRCTGVQREGAPIPMGVLGMASWRRGCWDGLWRVIPPRRMLPERGMRIGIRRLIWLGDVFTWALPRPSSPMVIKSDSFQAVLCGVPGTRRTDGQQWDRWDRAQDSEVPFPLQLEQLS